MRKSFFASYFLLSCTPVIAQSPGGSDIFLADMSTHDGRLQVRQLTNITERAGYDNQPYFLAEGDELLYTAELDGQTDIMRFDLNSNTVTNLTSSKVSEYSPTPMPNGTEFSVIASFDDKQQLWAYSLDDGSNRPILQNEFKIGYHAWIDPDHVLITVLQEEHMNLQVANSSTGQAKVVDPLTGASLFTIPGTDKMSFSTGSNSEHWLMAWDPKTEQAEKLVRLPDDARYYAWTPDGKVLVASRGHLWAWDSQQQSTELRAVANIEQACPEGASRIAVSPDQTRLALVCHGEYL